MDPSVTPGDDGAGAAAPAAEAPYETDGTVTPPAAEVVCPACGETVPGDSSFCEACGSELATPGRALEADPVPVPDPDRATGTEAGGANGANGAAPTPAAPAAAGQSLQADGEDEGFPVSCPSCGGTIAADGYCERCGERAPARRDHVEDAPGPGIALVCDRGIRHRRNEDAGVVDVGPHGGALLVVCDGVSSSVDSDVASLAAARAAAEVLRTALPAPAPSGPVLDPAPGGASADPDQPTGPMAVAPAGPTAPGGDGADGTGAGTDGTGADEAGADGVGSTPRESRAGVVTGVLVEATAVANRAVVDSLRPGTVGNPPSCTFVAGVVEPTPAGTLLVVGWIGDSRGYWVPDDGAPERLTTDDSWAAEEIALGVPVEEAESGPHAHAITRWLGPDAPTDRPRTVVRLLTGPGWVVLCSDGLWNYCSDPAALARTLRSVAEGAPAPLDLARGLVAWANERGGQDNITVALARVDG